MLALWIVPCYIVGMAPKTLDAIDTNQTSPPITQNPADIAQEIAQSGLKLSHQIFLNEYLVCRNATQAARKAGYSGTRVSVLGYKLLRKPEIKGLIESFDRKKLQVSEAKLTQVIERDITKESYLTMTQNFIDECGPKHSNTPTYLTIIGKVKGFFSDLVNNGLIVYNPGDSEAQASVNAKIQAFSRRLSRAESPTINIEDKSSK